MKSYFGFYSSSGTEPVACTVLVFDKNLSIGYKGADGSNIMLNWLIREVEAHFDLGRQTTQLRNSKVPGELLIEGNDAANFVKSMQAESQKPWHKKSSGREWFRNSLLFLGIAGLLVLLYLLIVPWLSQQLASKVSVKTEQQLGDAVYDALGLNEQEDKAASAVLNVFFRTMEVPTAYNIRITVVNDNAVNAFALPGGRIVVYKALAAGRSYRNWLPCSAMSSPISITSIQPKGSSAASDQRFLSVYCSGNLEPSPMYWSTMPTT
jgi:hypothetical protein